MDDDQHASRTGVPLSHARRGFTLVELLVVIALIGVLVALTLVAGSRLLDGGRARLTGDAIKALDSALSTYINETGGLPPAFVRDPRATEPNAPASLRDLAWPLADARDMSAGSGDVIINTVGLFMHHARSVPAVEASLAGLPSELIELYSPSENPGGNARNQQPRVSTVMDAWGNPIRMVHPAWHGLMHGGASNPAAGNVGTPVQLTSAESGNVNTYQVQAPSGTRFVGGAPRGTRVDVSQLRRNNRADDNGLIDADGGLTTAGRPYFYSAGPSGNPGLVDDNVYTARPTIAAFGN